MHKLHTHVYVMHRVVVLNSTYFENIREKYRLRSIYTFHLGDGRFLKTHVACAVQSTVFPLCHKSTDTLSPKHTLSTPLQRSSADYSQPHSENFCN
jgi:hypothetical protein